MPREISLVVCCVVLCAFYIPKSECCVEVLSNQ
jgi:hypothetical protein